MTFDVKASFINIPQDEGTKCAEEALNEGENQTIPTEFIVAMFRIF